MPKFSKKATTDLYNELMTIEPRKIPEFVYDKLENDDARFALFQKMFDEWNKSKSLKNKGQNIEARLKIMADWMAKDFEGGMAMRTREETVIVQGRTFSASVPDPLFVKLSKASQPDIKKMAHFIRHCAQFGVPFEFDSSNPQMTDKELNQLRRELNKKPRIDVKVNDYFTNCVNSMVLALRSAGVECIYYQNKVVPDGSKQAQKAPVKPSGRKKLVGYLSKNFFKKMVKEGSFLSDKRHRAHSTEREAPKAKRGRKK